MKGLVIIPSIRILQYWKDYEKNAQDNHFNLKDVEVLIIDETDKYREVNDKILENINHSFFGFEERNKWLNERELSLDIIPQKCHAETSFGLLYAYDKNKYDYIIFIDDDTKPTKDNYFGGHLNQLFNKNINFEIQPNGRKWNDLIPLSLYFSRGFPYSERQSLYPQEYEKIKTDVVINQGLWCNQLDLNATDILPNLNGLTKPIRYEAYESPYNVISPFGNFITVCSMNLSFKPEIISVFYQLPMNEFGIDRFDDIWSGIIIKKISDHLGKYISSGRPICEHIKEPRSTFKDLEAEAKGLGVNEELWKIIDNIELEDNNYRDCYQQIAFDIRDKSSYRTFLGEKMGQWIDVIDRLE